MAIRKSMEEELVVSGERSAWLTRCAKGLMAAGFAEVQANATLGQVSGKYRRFTAHGEVLITVKPAALEGNVSLTLRSTANVDNAFALFNSPNKKILSKAKAGIS
jgi:hypothetical protein